MVISHFLMHEKKINYRFTEDVYQMTGIRPGLYWQITWRYIGPTIMVVILASSILSMVLENPTYGAWNPDEVSQFFWLNFNS